MRGNNFVRRKMAIMLRATNGEVIFEWDFPSLSFLTMTTAARQI